MTTRSEPLVPEDLWGLLEELGVDVRRQSSRANKGDEISCICPVHEEETGAPQTNPHFSINTESGEWQCWSCRSSGGLLDLVLRILGGEEHLWKALRIIRRHGLSLADLEVRDLDTVKTVPNRLGAVGLLDQYQAMERVPDTQCHKRGLDPDQVWDYGVRWNGYWIIPVLSFDGEEFLGWQEKGDDHFLNRPTTMKKSLALFGYQHVEGEYPILLVESPLDVIRLATAGIGNAVASFGASVSEDQIKAILTKTERVILALDDDIAGWNEARRLKARYIKRLKMDVLHYDHVSVKDVGDMTDEEIWTAVDKAEPALTARMGIDAALPTRTRSQRRQAGVRRHH